MASFDLIYFLFALSSYNRLVEDMGSIHRSAAQVHLHVSRRTLSLLSITTVSGMAILKKTKLVNLVNSAEEKFSIANVTN